MNRLLPGWQWREPVDSDPNPVNTRLTTADDASLLQLTARRDRPDVILCGMLKPRAGWRRIA